MKIFVLGGGGFLGSHICEALLNNQHEVTVFDQPQARFLQLCRLKGAKIVTGNFLNTDDLGSALADCDVLYHLVSTTVPQSSNDNPQKDIESNLIGTVQLLELARKSGVKKVIFSSSGGTVYGIPQEIPIRENHPTKPISSYGIVKLAIEKYLHLYWLLYGLDYCVLRISNVYGERQPMNETQGIMGTFLGKAISGEPIQIWGDGSIIRDYVYVEDVARAFQMAATLTDECTVINIGSGEGQSVNNIVSQIENITGHLLQVKHLPSRPFDVPSNVLDISLAKTILKWQPEINLLEGLSRTYDWMKSQPVSSKSVDN
jgi:UDP-glucose 4-epimerase